jgi:hypothetical protein
MELFEGIPLISLLWVMRLGFWVIAVIRFSLLSVFYSVPFPHFHSRNQNPISFISMQMIWDMESWVAMAKQK